MPEEEHKEELNEHGEEVKEPLFDGDDKKSIYDDTLDRSRRQTKKAEKAGKSPGQLRAAEESGGAKVGKGKAETAEAGALGQHEKQIGEGYNDSDEGGRLSRLKHKVAGSRRKKIIIGGGIGAGIGGILVGSFLSFLPLKVNHIAENLQKHYYSSGESATEKRGEKLFADYLRKHVFPSMKDKPNCKSTLTNKDCVKIVDTDSPSKRLYKAWSENRLENKLATNYGLTFQKDGGGVKMFVKGDKNGIDVSSISSGKTLDEALEISGRNDIRSVWKDAFKNETKIRQMMYRFKVGRLLERKYGVRRCLFFCKTTDKFDDWKDKKKSAAKMLIVKRVVFPRDELVQKAMTCIITASCQPNEGGEEEGKDHEKHRDTFEKDAAKTVEESGNKALSFTAQELSDEIDKIMKENNGSISKYLINKTAEKVFSNEKLIEGVATATAETSKVSNVIGIIDTTAKFIKAIGDAGPQLKRWTYLINGTAMVTLYQMYRSHADELKNAKIDVELLGGTVDTLSDAAGNDEHKNQAAEVSPLYDNLMATPTPVKTSVLNLLSPTAYAQGTQAKYTCDDNQPIASGELVCPEEKLIPDNFITKFSALFDKPPLNFLKGAADVWSKTVGAGIKAVSDTLSKITDGILGVIPGYDTIKDKFAEILGGFVQSVSKYFIPDPIYDGMSGARTFNMAAGGADVSGNDFAHYALGGKKLSDAEVATIRTDRIQEEQETFAHKSLFARMFDKEDSKSMVSQLAMSMPMSFSKLSRSSVASLLSNPIGKLQTGFGSLFMTPKTKAATTADPFGVPQYGYPLNDAAFNADGDKYTDAYCDEQIQVWADSATKNDKTGLDEHNEVSPCLLERAATGSAGGIYSTDVLQPEDLQDPGSGGSASPGQPTGNNPGGIVGDPFETSVDIACAAGTEDVGVHDGYNDGNLVKIRLCAIPGFSSSSSESTPGTPYYVNGANGNVLTTSRVSGAILSLFNDAKAAGITFSATSSFRTMAHQQALWNAHPDPAYVAHPGNSNHQMGAAIDFSGIGAKGGGSCSSRAREPSNNKWVWLHDNAHKYGYKQYAKEAWHWDPSPSSNRCGPDT